MNLRQLLQGVNVIELSADEGLEISGLAYDSRRVEAGSLFVAIEGYQSDGHDYIPQAVENGAAAILCQRPPEQPGVPYVLAENPRAALAQLAVNWYGNPAKEMKIIGVTGTNGKTTTTTLIKSLLEHRGEKVGLIGTNHNMIGDRELDTEHTTPEAPELQALLREMAGAGCGYVVMEVSSHALFLNRVDGIEFDVGIFTNLTQDHLDFHSSMEEYLRAKAMLFTRSKQGIINMDDKSYEYLSQAAPCPIMTISLKDDSADLVAKSVKLRSDRVDFYALTTGKLVPMRLMIPGQFSVYNALCVIALGLTQGMALDEISAALRGAKGVKGRVEVAYSCEKYTILIDYAHTPDALENVLRTVKGFAPGRTVLLFGCGGDRDRTKRPKMGKIAGELADFVIVTSDNPRTEKPEDIINDIMEGMKGGKTPHKVIGDRRSAIAWAMDNAREGDVIILAGKGHETYQIIGAEKFHMDEREIIAEHIQNTERAGA